MGCLFLGLHTNHVEGCNSGKKFFDKLHIAEDIFPGGTEDPMQRPAPTLSLASADTQWHQASTDTRASDSQTLYDFEVQVRQPAHPKCRQRRQSL